MESMAKTEVLERLKRIQRRSNENSMAVLAIINAVHDEDGELNGETSSGIRDKLYRLECDGTYDVKDGITSLETSMYDAEKRCYECGERIESEDGVDDGNGNLHSGCAKKLA